MDNRNKIFAVVGTIAVLATAGVIGIGLFIRPDTNTNTSSSSATTTSNSTTSANTSTSSSSSYKDGSYTATVSYMVPHGNQNTLKATVVVSGGKITSVSTTDDYSDRESSMYVNSFENGVSSDATGQSLGSYNPSQIGGASLTTAAFNDAISQIRTQAQA